MIRSASSLLSIIDQQIEAPRSASDDRSVRSLDRIALLFVTNPKQNVSAVSALLALNNSILVCCTESDSPPPESDEEFAKYLLVSKNSRNPPSADPPLVGSSPSFQAMYGVHFPCIPISRYPLVSLTGDRCS